MLDLTFVNMVNKRDTITQRNKRAREYSKLCAKRNKAKFERIADKMVNILIVIISLAITCVLLLLR